MCELNSASKKKKKKVKAQVVSEWSNILQQILASEEKAITTDYTCNVHGFCINLQSQTAV